MNNIKIRPYQSMHWEKVCDLHDKARPLELAGSCDPLAFISLKEDEVDLDDFHASTKFVAYIRSELVGFVGVRELQVSWLYVDPEYFGLGVGRGLLQKALDCLERPAEIHVLSENVRAIGLYESVGFVLKSRFPSDVNGYPCTILKYVKW